VTVQDNQVVESGTRALVVMDTQEFDIELISARSEYSAAVLERESARATRDAAKLTNAELEAERLRAKIDLLEFKKASADLGAPIAGIVSAPGLAEREGSTINQGDTLFEVSDPASFMLDLAIPQEVVGRIKEPATGRFRPDYDPTVRVGSAITLVSPALSTQHEVPVFLGEATLDSASALRPGMRGVLAVEQPFQPVWFIVWRAVRNWVLLRLWF
jgi:multidrug resistance efflux pump